MRINPYLIFDGQCRSAFRFYEQVLGGKITFSMTYGESPSAADVPKEHHDRIIHTTLEIGDQLLQGSDAHGEYDKPQGVHVSLSLKDTGEGKRIFDSLSEKGTVQMPFEKTFWAAGFGMCVDRFGIPWMVNCEKEE